MERSSLVTAAQPHGIYTRFPISPYALARALCSVSTTAGGSGSEKERCGVLYDQHDFPVKHPSCPKCALDAYKSFFSTKATLPIALCPRSIAENILITMQKMRKSLDEDDWNELMLQNRWSANHSPVGPALSIATHQNTPLMPRNICPWAWTSGRASPRFVSKLRKNLPSPHAPKTMLGRPFPPSVRRSMN